MVMQWKFCHRIIAFCVIGWVFTSCANRGIGPQGGPRDSIPPAVVRQIPENGTLNYQNNRIEVVFDEYIQLDNVVDNVLISPPQLVPPEVKAIGKKLSFVFQDTLKDSTTYTIDFGRAICDFTEKNPLEGYAISFSTGNRIDSLELEGTLINAENLNPVFGVIMGIHSNLQDSAFETMPFERIARTDSMGHFTIRNIRGGQYRLYGLRDVSRDYMYQPGENVAYSDTIFTPRVDVRYDTIRSINDTLNKPNDTLPEVKVYTTYSPKDVSLWYFKEQKIHHYLQRSKRETPHTFALYFSSPQDSMPVIHSLPLSVVDTLRSDSLPIEDWMNYVLWQVNTTRDTIVGWLTDSVAIAQDSIAMEIEYLKTDSLYQLYPNKDTVTLIWRQPNLSVKAQEARNKKERERKLRLTSNASANFNFFDTLRIRADVPVKEVQYEQIHLYQKVDTTYQLLDVMFYPTDSSKLNFLAIYPFESERQYELRIDSAAMHDIYGKANDATKFQLTVKSKEEYSSVKIVLKHFDSRAVLQLLSNKDEVVRQLPASEQGTLFENLDPTDYFLRLFIDLNGDGKWTTGDWATHRQPEMVYYFPNKLSLRANWDFEETFDHLAIPQTESKPSEIRVTHLEQKK